MTEVSASPAGDVRRRALVVLIGGAIATLAWALFDGYLKIAGALAPAVYFFSLTRSAPTPSARRNVLIAAIVALGFGFATLARAVPEKLLLEVGFPFVAALATVALAVFSRAYATVFAGVAGFVAAWIAGLWLHQLVFEFGHGGMNGALDFCLSGASRLLVGVDLFAAAVGAGAVVGFAFASGVRIPKMPARVVLASGIVIALWYGYHCWTGDMRISPSACF